MSTLLALDRVPAVAAKLAIGARTSGNGFTLKWTVLPAELSTAPRFIGIGSSTFAGNGASVYANSVAGKLATQLNVVAPGTGVLCNNALAQQDTRNGLPNGADALVRENRNISMALAANPTAIIIAFPNGDIGNGITPAQFRDNINTMYSLARQRSIPAFVIGPQPRTAYTAAQQTLLLNAADLIKDVIPVEFYVDVMEALRDTTSSKPADINPAYDADSIHPNDTGHAIIYTSLWDRISNYFVTPAYTGYLIESAVVTANGEIPAAWSTFDTISTGSIVSKTYTRSDGNWHAYRVTATNADGTTTTPSDPIWIYQPIASVATEQTVQLDFSLDTVIAPPADWNNFVAPSAGPSLNQSLALITNSGAASGITATVTKVFSGASTGGANSGVYPQRVMSDSWYLSPTLATRAQLKLSGVLTTNVYNIEFVSSRDTTTIDRIVCLTVNDGTGVDKRDGLACTTAPNVPNQTNIRTLEGIVPASDGTITIDIHCAGPLAYLNGMVIRRMSNV